MQQARRKMKINNVVFMGKQSRVMMIFLMKIFTVDLNAKNGEREHIQTHNWE
jgi:hypothetical protein